MQAYKDAEYYLSLRFAFDLFYRGRTWLLCDAYLVGDNKTSGMQSLIIGYGGFLLLAALEWLYGFSGLADAESASLCMKIVKSISGRFRSYLVGFLVINSWRGFWLLQEYIYPSNPITSAWISHAIGVLVLVDCLHLQSISAPPVLVAPDNDQNSSDSNCKNRQTYNKNICV